MQTWDWLGQMWREAFTKAAREQIKTWAEHHAHCGHARNNEASILCDITEAYVTYCDEIRAKEQRTAWRASEPKVRNDDTRIVRDHHFALEMNANFIA